MKIFLFIAKILFSFKSADLHSLMSDIISIWLTNKEKPAKPICLYIKRFTDMYQAKMHLTRFFSQKIRKTITGFRLVRRGPPEDDINDTISENYFDDKYDNYDAFNIFEKINEIYKTSEEKKPLIYFRVIKENINIKIFKSNEIQYISFPLAYSNNTYDELISDIQEQIQTKFEIKHHIFQNTPNLDKIDQEIDMKHYSQTGLILYLFPLKVLFHDLSTNEVAMLFPKLDQPLSVYLPKVFEMFEIKSDSSRYSFQFHDDPNKKVDINVPTHQILKMQTEEPVQIDLIQVKKTSKKSKSQPNVEDDENCEEEEEEIDYDEKPPIETNHNRHHHHHQHAPQKDMKADDNFIIDSEEEAEKYKIVDQIGEGKTSIVFRIIEKETKKFFCKKVLKIESAEFKDAKNAIKEFEILHLLNHPCICHAYKLNPTETLEDGNSTISMIIEYIYFRMTDYLASKLVNSTLKTKFVIEISHGMKYLHSKNLIYRDLNVDNIMLNLNLEVKMIDFGLAHICDVLYGEEAMSNFSLTKNVGSDAFMSPEMSNDDDYDSKTDVYSFGVVVYYIFTGKLPNQTFRDKMKLKPISLPKESESISKVCIELMKRCLSIKPKDRPTFSEILDFLRKNKYMLASDVEQIVIERRDNELELANK